MVKQFFIDLYNLLLGAFTVFKHSFKRRITEEYPEQKPNLPQRFRGKHVWKYENCCVCKTCERVCPANAISVEKNEKGITFNIDLKRCIFCGNCMYYCPKKAINMTNNFELATDNKENLIIATNSFNSDNNSNIIKKD